MIVTAEQTFCFIASWTGLEAMLLHLNLRISKIWKVFQQNHGIKVLGISVSSCCGRKVVCWRPAFGCLMLGSMSTGDPNKSHWVLGVRVQKSTSNFERHMLRKECFKIRVPVVVACSKQLFILITSNPFKFSTVLASQTATTTTLNAETTTF